MISSCCGLVALSHALISAFVLRQPRQNPVISSMEQMEMQGETIPVFLPTGVSGVAVGVGRGAGFVMRVIVNHKTGEIARGYCVCFIGVCECVCACLCLPALFKDSIIDAHGKPCAMAAQRQTRALLLPSDQRNARQAKGG